MIRETTERERGGNWPGEAGAGVASALGPSAGSTFDARRDEDARIARWLLAAAITTPLLSAPMFLAHFREAVAASPVITPGVPAFMALELAKVALFSWVATALGRRTASAAGFDAPAVRALVRGDRGGALRALRDALPTAIALGVTAFAVGVAIRAPLEGTSIGDYLARHTDRGTPLVRATGVFYGFAVTLWFRWCALAVASRFVSRVTRLDPARAFPIANVLAALCYGLFAMISILGPHAGEPGAWRYVLEAMAGSGIPGVLTASAVRKRGFESAVLADATSALLGATLQSVASALR